jgi:hypothetical protein
MQPMTPKFRRLLKRLDRRLKDHDLEAFDAAVADQVRQYYVDNDPAYAAALARSAPAAAPATAAAVAVPRPAPAVRSFAAARRPALPTPAVHAHHDPAPPGDAAAVSRVLHRAIAEEQRAGRAKPKARAKAARPRAAKPALRKATTVKKTAAKKTTAKKAPRRER